MRIAGVILGTVACLCASFPASAQMTLEEAREEGKALGNQTRHDDALVPTENAWAEAVPGYSGTSLPESTYFDTPENMEAAAHSAKSGNEHYRIATDADHSRATFSNAEILSTTARASAVENDPSTYLAGEEISGNKGSCVPLPPGTSGAGDYEASCNVGEKVTQDMQVCRVPMVPQFTQKTTYRYTCGHIYQQTNTRGNWDGESEISESCHGFESAPQCSLESEKYTTYRQYIGRVGSGINLYHSWKESTYTCSSPTTSPNGNQFCIAFGCYGPEPVKEIGSGPAYSYSGSKEDLSLCSSAVQQGQCELQDAVCADSDPVTRTVNGVEVTQPCWAWSKTYRCTDITADNDCSTLDANKSCSYLRTECLDDPQEGPCKVENRVYKCPTPSSGADVAPQYICGGDVYCINGDCEPIVREASTEFKDALVALHAIDQAGEEFDENNLTVFKGTRETCHKPVFGLINCCAGKVSGLLTVGAGGAALAGGPVAIAAMATPFLALFACSQDEMKLDIKDRMGFCHNVGTYCSSSILGICKTRRTAYCCYESKLSRVLQEQGRVQLDKPWGAPKKEQCLGFTIDEFARLDLSIMDFTEVYADFIDAAKLPDEVETMTQIQQKIQDYYDLHGK